MKLKTLAVGLCTIALLAGCGAKGDDAKSEKEDKTIRIGASVTPHAEILKHVKPALEKKGYKVENRRIHRLCKTESGTGR